MKVTKSGEKATKLRGYKRIWLLDLGYRFEIIEVKPGVRIEDIDTKDVAWRGFDNVTFTTLIEGGRHYKYEGANCSGWIVSCGNDYSDPIPNKTEALALARYDLANIKNWHWKD